MNGYVLAGYAVTLVACGGYAVRLVLRGRKVTRDLPEEDRPWR